MFPSSDALFSSNKLQRIVFFQQLFTVCPSFVQRTLQTYFTAIQHELATINFCRFTLICIFYDFLKNDVSFYTDARATF